MRKETYLKILKFGSLLGFVAVYLVWGKLLFPYISTKQIYFNVLIEILMIFWLTLMVKFPEARPKKNLVSFGLIAYFGMILLSCFSGVDFNLSFWGDIERMLGFFHLVHFLFFYFIIITAFRTWKDWKLLFLVSVIWASIIGLIGIFGNPYSKIGNTAYVAGYMIFNIYFALLLFFKTESRELRWLYALPLVIMLISFYRSDSSGGLVGLGVSLVWILFLYGILSKNKKIKTGTLSVLVLFVVMIGSLFIFKNSDFVQNSSALRPIREISLQKNTFQTRLISWKAALKDFPNHVFLGTGYGNYAITFDKFFEAKFYSYTSSETYFDRAHNNLIDIASTTGLLGLLSYLSIFVALFYYLATGYFNKKINTHELVLISGVIVGYFVQNLAVFDSLVTYISLMAVLGYVYFLINRDEIENSDGGAGLDNKEIYSLVIFGLISVFIIFQYNIQPLKMIMGTIDSQIAYAQGDIVGSYEASKEALSYDTGLDRDSRSTFIKSAQQSAFGLLKQIDPEKGKEILDYAVDLAKKNVAYNPADSMNQMVLAQILQAAAVYWADDIQVSYNYSNQALEAIEKSLAASPERVNIYFTKAQILISRGDKDGAIAAMEYALNLNPEYRDSYCNLAQVYFTFDEEEKGVERLNSCLDMGGANIFTSSAILRNFINRYADLGDTARVIKLYERLSQVESTNYEVFVNLSQLYVQAGKNEKAIEAAEKAAELNPSLSSSVAEFIRGLQSGN